MSLDSVLDILKTFKGHVGRKGQRGGSLPRNQQTQDKLGRNLFDNSKVKVSARDGEEEYVEESIHHLFGRELNTNEIAGLVGAPNGAKITLSTVGRDLWIETTHKDFEEKQIRIIRRFGETLEMQNESFSVNKEAPQGLGTRIFANQLFKSFGKLGINYIRTTAGGSPDSRMNGYYTWARLGYQNGDDISSYVKKVTNEDNLHDIMKTQKGREVWKKYGGQFEGIFDLTKGSTSRKILSNYIKAKGYYYGQ